MSTSPVTMMVARRVADGHYQDMLVWLQEGEQLATDFPGYLGSGVLAPPPGDNEFQMIFRFSNPATLHAWEHSASRKAWLERGSDLFARPSEHRVSGLEGWFGATLETERGDLAGVLPGLIAVQLRPGAITGRTGTGATHSRQYPDADAADGLLLHSSVHPPAGRLAARYDTPVVAGHGSEPGTLSSAQARSMVVEGVWLV